MSDSSKAKAADRAKAREWEKSWAEAATQRLKNSARGEWSPWQTMKMAATSIPLQMYESGAYGGWSEATSSPTQAREAAFEEAMKFANERANAREKVQAAIDSGNETPQAIERGKAYLAQDPALASAWLKMYPQYKPVAVQQVPSGGPMLGRP